MVSTKTPLLMMALAGILFSASLMAQEDTSRRIGEIFSDKRYQEYRVGVRRENASNSNHYGRNGSSSIPGENSSDTSGSGIPEGGDGERTSVDRAQRSPAERVQGSDHRSARRNAATKPDTRYDGGGTSSPSSSGVNLSGFGALFQGVMYILLAVALATIIFGIVRALQARQANEKSKLKKESKKLALVESIDDDDEPAPAPYAEADKADLLSRLQAALSAGDFAAATVLRYKLFWARNGWPACLDENDAHTWRDALRWISNDELRRQTGRCLRRVEAVRYGHYLPSKAEYLDWESGLPIGLDSLVGVGT